MKTVISRTYTPAETLGSLTIFDGKDKKLEIVSLELPWRNNQHDISCIPESVYKITKIHRPNGKRAFLIHNVQDRDAILIHVANYAAGKKIDLKGCIAPGMKFEDINKDGYPDAKSSTEALDKMWNILPDESILYII